MRIFILDDKPSRLETFKKKYKGNDLVLVRSFQDAVRALRSSPKFDLVSLDYDIADFEPANEVGFVGRKKTGLDVAYYIAEDLPEEKRPTKAIVHSLNTQRAPVMQDALERVGIRTEYEPYEGER